MPCCNYHAGQATYIINSEKGWPCKLTRKSLPESDVPSMVFSLLPSLFPFRSPSLLCLFVELPSYFHVYLSLYPPRSGVTSMSSSIYVQVYFCVRQEVEQKRDPGRTEQRNRQCIEQDTSKTARREESEERRETTKHTILQLPPAPLLNLHSPPPPRHRTTPSHHRHPRTPQLHYHAHTAP